ncbi:MAG: carbohydrate ABC transporter permease [Clostridia bacterium]|nr:carbohydrate ABC transporter permease [Clostridia bacterium]
MVKKNSLLSATASEKIFDTCVMVILAILFLLWFFPLLYVVLASVTPYKDVIKGSLLIIPSSITFTGYSYIFNSTNIFASFRNTLIITVCGTALSMTVSVLLAYPLSKKELPGRALLLKLLVFTMYFSGGLIPTYMVVRNVGLQNTIWAMIVPGALSVYNMLLIKSYFESLPAGLLDAAIIDGCGPMRTLIQIALPLSLPVLMSVMLFYMVGYWNTYYSYVYYCYDKSLRPLQVVLHEIIQRATGEAEAEEYIPTITVQMSAIVFACLPIICVYPFLQKYFTKGVMLGAIKG